MPCLLKISQEGYGHICEIFFLIIYNFSCFCHVLSYRTWAHSESTCQSTCTISKDCFGNSFFTWSFVTVFKDKNGNLFLAYYKKKEKIPNIWSFLSFRKTSRSVSYWPAFIKESRMPELQQCLVKDKDLKKYSHSF